MVPIPSYVIHPHIIKAMCAPWPEFKQKGVHFSPGRLQIKTFVHTHFLPTHVTKFNSTPVLIYRFLSVQIILRTTYMWIFSSYVFFWNVYFDTIQSQNSLHITHISCRGCFLFAFTTESSFWVSLFDNKDGLPLRLWFYTPTSQNSIHSCKWMPCLVCSLWPIDTRSK